MKIRNLIPQFLRRKSVTKTETVDIRHARTKARDEFVVGEWYTFLPNGTNILKYHGQGGGYKSDYNVAEGMSGFDGYGLWRGEIRTWCIEVRSNWRKSTQAEIDTVLKAATPEQRAILDSIVDGVDTPLSNHFTGEITGATLYNEGGTKYPWKLVKSTKHKVMYFLKANYPNAYTGREIARATGLNTSQVGGALKHCGDHVTKVGTHVGPKGCVGFKWQGVLKDRI